jgi:tungstate transport system substrate-binding protein
MIRVIALILSIIVVSNAEAQDRFIALSSTTSTQDSGLFGHILPVFRATTGIGVHVVTVGTGQALAIGRRGDADALLVHDYIGENKFVADGYGIDRRHVMYNDFIIVGPNTDPAGIRGFNNARKADTNRRRRGSIYQPGRRQRHQSSGASFVEIGCHPARPT